VLARGKKTLIPTLKKGELRTSADLPEAREDKRALYSHGEGRGNGKIFSLIEEKKGTVSPSPHPQAISSGGGGGYNL